MGWTEDRADGGHRRPPWWSRQRSRQAARRRGGGVRAHRHPAYRARAVPGRHRRCRLGRGRHLGGAARHRPRPVLPDVQERRRHLHRQAAPGRPAQPASVDRRVRRPAVGRQPGPLRRGPARRLGYHPGGPRPRRHRIRRADRDRSGGAADRARTGRRVRGRALHRRRMAPAGRGRRLACLAAGVGPDAAARRCGARGRSGGGPGPRTRQARHADRARCHEPARGRRLASGEQAPIRQRSRSLPVPASACRQARARCWPPDPAGVPRWPSTRRGW